MRAAADDVGGDFPDIVPADTRNLMGFFVSLRKLMMEVGEPFARIVIVYISSERS